MFTKEQKKTIASLLATLSDEELYELFEGVYHFIIRRVDAIHEKEQPTRDPYQFNHRFPDLG